MTDHLSKCNTCVVCGSTRLRVLNRSSVFGDELYAIGCDNDDCKISAKESREQSTAVRYWNRLSELNRCLTNGVIDTSCG